MQKEQYVSILKRLREDGVDVVKMGPGAAESLKSNTNYRQATVEWNDGEQQKKVRNLIKMISGLDTSLLRSTRPLIMDVYDNRYRSVSPVNLERICDYPFSPNEEFYIKIRRMRNAPIESLRLLLGPSINAQSLELKGLEVRDLGVDIASRGRLWKIFVQNQNSPLQNGIWAKMVVVPMTMVLGQRFLTMARMSIRVVLDSRLSPRGRCSGSEEDNEKWEGNGIPPVGDAWHGPRCAQVGRVGGGVFR